jgi:hypothetical protein
MEIVESASRKMVDAVHRSIHDYSRLARELGQVGSDRSSANCLTMKNALGYACLLASVLRKMSLEVGIHKYECHVGGSVKGPKKHSVASLS